MLVTLLVLLSSVLISDGHNLYKRQADIKCYQRCPDPRYMTNQNPCGSCDHSQCRYEGCVYHGAFYSYWIPEPCSKCYCINNIKQCYLKECPENLDCYGYPKVIRPGKCCEECDFGDSELACSLIPVSSKRHNGKDTRGSCKRVVMHDCNRRYVYADGKWYSCTSHAGYTGVRDSPGCRHMRGRYRDNVSCRQHEIKDSRSIPSDYDPYPQCYPLPPE